jgi:hypothetical protein
MRERGRERQRELVPVMDSQKAPMVANVFPAAAVGVRGLNRNAVDGT